jgi:hypothetical protein
MEAAPMTQGRVSGETGRSAIHNCEVEGALTYAYEGRGGSPPTASLEPCAGHLLCEFTLLRSEDAAHGPHLAWKSYRLCETHYGRLVALDRMRVSMSLPSRMLSAPVVAAEVDAYPESVPF